jgi:hypothetical protein
MMRRSLEDLAASDLMTRRFTPYGLGIGYALSPEDSADYIQELVARHSLVPEVPESLRKVYERLRTTHAYGALEYDLFTVAESLAFLVFEGALRARFVDAYGGVIPFVNSAGAEEHVPVTAFDEVFQLLTRGGRFSSRREWSLRGATDRDYLHRGFGGSFPSLLKWARLEGFLSGQRSRVVENLAIVHLRNSIAHPERYHLCTPVDSARTIGDVAEFVNRLWGRRTPGGRLYPAPVERRPIVVVRSLDGVTSTMLQPADLLALHADPAAEAWRSDSLPLHRTDEWTFTFALCPGNLDPLFYEHIAGWDRAPFPIDVLWGPGPLAAAVDAWSHHSDDWIADTVETVDRVFLIRYPAGQDPEFPMSIQRAQQLERTARAGQWLVVVADIPTDALEHARKLGEPTHPIPKGECDECRVRAHGLFSTWAQAIAVAAKLR